MQSKVYKNQAEYILTELGLVELWVGEQKRLDRAATSVRVKNQNSDLKSARRNRIPEKLAVQGMSNSPSAVDNDIWQDFGLT